MILLFYIPINFLFLLPIVLFRNYFLSISDILTGVRIQTKIVMLRFIIHTHTHTHAKILNQQLINMHIISGLPRCHIWECLESSITDWSKSILEMLNFSADYNTPGIDCTCVM